jgi:hypothetical protein
MVEAIGTSVTHPDSSKVQLLKGKMLQDSIFSIEPVLSPLSAIGFAYPQVESLLGFSTDETISILDSLAGTNEIDKQLNDELLACPKCRSSNLEPAQGCPQCNSKNISRGRILEHFHCGYLGLEEEYITAGKYMCPKCRNEVRFLGTDYASLGMNYKCRDCSNIFSEAVPLRTCLKCSNQFSLAAALDTTVYSYHVNEAQQIRLKFDLGPQARLIRFLESRGYTVTVRAKASGPSKSGAVHTFDLVSTRNDGFIFHTICADVIISGSGREIGLEEVFKFDNKAYDLGIQDKVLFVIPSLTTNAAQMARRQGIKVIQDKELDTLLDSVRDSPPSPVSSEPFQFQTKSSFLKHLQDTGYVLKKGARITGRSGVVHTMDILAHRDDGIIDHVVNIGVLIEDPLVSIDTVFLYDTRSFDAGIHDKVLIASPGLAPEAKQFALHQKIKLIEVPDASKLR